MNLIVIIILSAAGGIGLISAVFGAVRKFTKTTWIGWQVLLIFGLVWAFSKIPSPQGAVGQFIVTLIASVVIVAVPLLLEGLFRHLLLKNPRVNNGPASLGARFADRFFGAISGMLAAVAFFCVVGGFALLMTEAFMGPITDIPIWNNFYAGYAADMMLLSLLLVVLRAGYRLGVLRGLYMLCMIVLSLGSFIGIFLFFKCTVAGMGASRTVGGWFKLATIRADLIGGFVMTLISFLIFSVLLILLSRLIAKGVMKADKNGALSKTGAVIVGALFAIFFLALVMGIQYLFATLQGMGVTADGETAGQIGQMLAPAAERIVGVLRSSPVSQRLYDSNLLTVLING